MRFSLSPNPFGKKATLVIVALVTVALVIVASLVSLMTRPRTKY